MNYYTDYLESGLTIRLPRIVAVLLTTILFLYPSEAQSATEWVKNGDGNWGAANQNWSNGLPSLTSTARFVQSRIDKVITVNLNGNRSARGIFTNKASQTKVVPGNSTSNVLTLGSVGLEVTQAPSGPAPGRIWIEANVALAASQTWLAARAGTGDDILLSNHTLNIGPHELTVNGPGGTTISSAIVGSGFLDKKGEGTLYLSGNNSFSGGTQTHNGTLRVPSAERLGTGTATLSGGSLRVDSSSTIDAPLFFEDVSSLVIPSGNVTQQKHKSGAAAWEKSGDGTLTLLGSSSATGRLTVANGKVATAVGSITPNVTVNSGASLEFLGGGIYAGSIDGLGGLVKSGGGTLELRGVNAPKQGTTITGGALQINTNALSGAINIGSDQELIFDQNFHGTYSSEILGNGAVYKRGGGVLTLAGNPSTGRNSYKRGTFVEAGQLRGTPASIRGPINVSRNASIVFERGGTFAGTASGGGSIIVSRGANIDFSGDISGVSLLELDGGGAASARPDSLPPNVNIGNSPNINCICLSIEGSGTYNGVISGAGGFSISGGTLTITQVQQNGIALVAPDATLNISGSVNNVNVDGTLTGSGYANLVALNPGSQLTGSLTFGALSNESIVHTIELEPGSDIIPYSYDQGSSGALNLSLPISGLLQGKSYFNLYGGQVTLHGDVPPDVNGGIHWPILTASSVFADSLIVDIAGGSGRVFELVGRELNGKDMLFVRETPIDFLEGDANGDGVLDAEDAPIMAYALFNSSDVFEITNEFGGTRVYFDFIEKLDLAGEADGVIDLDDLEVFSQLLEAAIGPDSASIAMQQAIVRAAADRSVPEPSTVVLLLLVMSLRTALRQSPRDSRRKDTGEYFDSDANH